MDASRKGVPGAEHIDPAEVLELLRQQCQLLIDRGVPPDVVEAALFAATWERLVLTRGWAGAAALLHDQARNIETEIPPGAERKVH